jgi:hypothetical protein
MAEFQFFAAPGAEFSDDDAAVLGTRFIKLAQEERLTPEQVVEDARPKDSPTHRYFEWDDAIAAGKYRLSQAGHLLRNVCVVPAPHREPMRAEQFMTVRAVTHGEASGPRVASMSPVEHARRELEAWRARYAPVPELQPIVALIIDALARLGESEGVALDRARRG